MLGQSGNLPSLLAVSSIAFRNFHNGFAWFVILGNAFAGVWSLLAHKKPSLRTRALWWFTAIAEVSVFIQVIIGTYMVAGLKYKHPKFHSFYGFVAIIAVGILGSYRRQLASRKYLLYGGGGLFIMGLGIRAMLVGVAE
jgi:hypothetical protein